MPEGDIILMILLAGVFGVLVMILVVLGSISRSLARMERRMGKQEGGNPGTVDLPTTGESLRKAAQKEDFLVFLSEDPQRRQLPKREQFAAYRTWRKDKGLNWPRVSENSPAG